MKKILYIDACVRDNSRTRALGEKLLSTLDGDVRKIRLDRADLLPLDGERLRFRDSCCEKCDFSSSFFAYAKAFRDADEIVISAPFWDLGFPALLKIYFENVTVAGLTFRYVDGKPTGLCRAKKLYYVTTSGGPIFADYGYTYVKTLATTFFNIPTTTCIRVQNTDVLNLTPANVHEHQEIID